MLSFKKISFALALIISLCGCLEQKLLFDFDKNVNAPFFKEIPGIGNVTYLGKTVTKKADKLEVYQSTFRERFIEKDKLLEYTELNDDSKIRSADYWDVIGYSQDLYMLKFSFEFLDVSGGNTKPTSEEGIIYFSVKKNGNDDVIGITPCYFGIINRDFNYIGFDTPLSLQKQSNNFYLKVNKKNPKLPGLLFMPATFPKINKASASKNTAPVLNIEKIVRLDANKIGGRKPLVFNISQIFHDPTALQFHYVNTISLTP